MQTDEEKAARRASPAGPAPMARAGPAAQPPNPVVLDSQALLRGRREILIRHAGEEYRLRLTGNNKLILTK